MLEIKGYKVFLVDTVGWKDEHETDLIELERERLIVIPRQYTLDFRELARKTTTATKLYDQMLARYPESLNRAGIDTFRFRERSELLCS